MPPKWSLHDETSGAVLGTFPTRALGDAAVGLVATGHAWTLWEWVDSTSTTGEVADHGTGPLHEPLLITKAQYRIEYVERPASAAEHRRHITGIDTVEPDGARRHWDDVALVRDAMADGDAFYTQQAMCGRASAVEPYDCPCGAATIRSCLDPPAEQNLDNVAT
ncbi:MAG TPA: hypothetical protein VIK61_16075, partial [Acidimicrobiia bacterium]